MSFNAEIKDFLSASQSVMKTMGDSEYKRQLSKQSEMTTKKMEADLNDPLKEERQKAEIAAIKARTANSYSAINQRNLQNKALANPQEDAVASTIGGPAPRYGVTPAIPAEEPVQQFASGGLVDEDSDPSDEDDIPAPAIGPTDVSARSRDRISQDAGYDAVNAGLKYGVQSLGAAGVPTQQRRQRMQALSRGAGAAPLADMQQIFKKIDPQGQMGDSERNIAALSAVYQYKLRAGDPQGAQRAAFTMLQHYRLASQRYAAIAAAAAEHGDVDGAAKAAMKAYANIPDGKDFKVTKTQSGQLQYTLTDEKTGKTVSQGIASPQQLAAAAMGVATKGFDQFLLQAAGERHSAKSGGEATPQGNKAPRQTDLKAIKEGVDQTVDDFAEQAKITDKAQVTALKNSSYHIAQENPSLASNEAFDIARTIITAPTPKKGEAGAFKITRDEDTGKNTVMIGDTGQKAVLSDDALRPIMVLRGKAEKAREAEAKSKEGKKSYGDYASDAMGAIGNVASDAGRAIKAGGEAIGGAIGRGASAVGGVLENPAMASSGRNALRAIGNPDDNPGVDNPL